MKAKDLKNKGVPITLGDQTYELKFNMNTFCELEEVYDDINQAFEDLQKMKVKAMRALIYAAVKTQNDTITLQEIGELLGISELEDISKALNEALSDAMPEASEDTLGE